jgi:hypothetical protein
MNISVTDLIDYTKWEREKFHELFRREGEQALKISLGLHGDGRFRQTATGSGTSFLPKNGMWIGCPTGL